MYIYLCVSFFVSLYIATTCGCTFGLLFSYVGYCISRLMLVSFWLLWFSLSVSLLSHHISGFYDSLSQFLCWVIIKIHCISRPLFAHSLQLPSWLAWSQQQWRAFQSALGIVGTWSWQCCVCIFSPPIGFKFLFLKPSLWCWLMVIIHKNLLPDMANHP